MVERVEQEQEVQEEHARARLPVRISGQSW